MSDRDIQLLAELLAAHALVLLGLGIVAILATAAAVAGAVRAITRFREPLRATYASLTRHVEGTRAWRLLSRVPRLRRPSAYLLLHLALGLVLTIGATVFLIIAEEVVSGGALAAFDVAFARALRQAATPPWERVFAAVTWFGSGVPLGGAALAVAVALFHARQHVLAVGWVVGQAGSGVLIGALKETFQRTRPEFAGSLLATSWSFPSGHAMGTFVFAGLGAYLLVRRSRSWTARAVVVGVALAWCVTMAFSRLYLGVHFLSDVVAGVFAGAAWVAVCVSAIEVVQRRVT